MSILSPSKLAPRAAGSTTDTDNFFNDAFNDDLTSHAPANFGSVSSASGLTESPSTSQAASVASDVISGVVASPETITLQGSGLVFINTYGSGVTDAYRNAIISAENDFQSHFTNAVTLRMSFDLQLIDTHFSGQNTFGQSLVRDVSYSTLRNALQNHATTADDIASVNSLPATDPSNGLGFDVPIGMARILNLAPAGTGNDDAILLNSYYWNSSNISNGVGVLEHEISEGAMGRIGSLGIWDTGNWAPMDLFRYSAVGQRDYTGGSDSRPTYFSVDGSQLLTQFHNSLVFNAALGRFVYDGYDLADWDNTSGDSFGPGGPNSPGVLTATDLRIMDILGWTPPGSSVSDDYRNSLTDLSHPFGTVAVNGSSTGRLEVVGDRDWFSVQLVAGTTYIVDLQGAQAGGGSLVDPYLRVHDGAGNLLAENDDIILGVNRDSHLSFAASVTGTYYLEAGAFDDSYTGTYRISIHPNHAPTVTVANVTTTSGQSIAASSLFHGSDADGDALSYVIYDGTAAASSGHFVVGGTVIPAGIAYSVSEAQLAQTWFVAGAAGTTDDLRVIAYDGHAYSGNGIYAQFHVNVSIVSQTAPNDFNGDGKSDILWRNDAGAIATWDMNDGTLLRSNSFGAVPANWHIAGTSDFNGDGRTDILWRNDAGAIATWDMNDGTILSTHSLGAVPDNWHILGTGDFNADHNADILWRNDAGMVAIWDLNDGTLLSSKNLGIVPSNWHFAGTNDFNADGRTDILWRNDAGVIQTWDMDDATLLAAHNLGSVPDNWHFVSTGDFNGDHNADILWQNDAGIVAIWDLSNSTLLNSKNVGLLPSNWHIADTGDYNGDQKTDILLRNDAGITATWDMNDNNLLSSNSLGFVPANWHIVV